MRKGWLRTTVLVEGRHTNDQRKTNDKQELLRGNSPGDTLFGETTWESGE